MKPIGSTAPRTGLVIVSALNVHSGGNVDYKDILKRWLDNTPHQWQFRDEFRTTEVRGAALPMGFNRQPAYTNGLLLVGDAGGMVNPFNGEGIAYAMESGRLASEVIAQAFARQTDAGREKVLQSYPRVMKDALGGYYTLGRGFAKMIGNPEIMRLAVKYGLPRTTMMKFLLKIMANLAEPHGGGAGDRLINALSKIAPAS